MRLQMNKSVKLSVFVLCTVMSNFSVLAAESTVKRQVFISKPKQILFEETLNVMGDFKAKNTAIISAEVSGVLNNIEVDEGDMVMKGSTKLFESESSNLQESVVIATHQVSVSKAYINEKEANLERVIADFDKAKLDYERYKRLFENDNAVTKHAFELHRSKYLQLKASIKHAKTLVTLAEAQQIQAKSKLTISYKNLSDTTVVAPISGTVVARYVEPGERVNIGQRILEISDLSKLEISIRIPEKY